MWRLLVINCLYFAFISCFLSLYLCTCINIYPIICFFSSSLGISPIHFWSKWFCVFFSLYCQSCLLNHYSFGIFFLVISRIWNETWLSSFFYKPCNYELFVKQSLNMEMAIVMARYAVWLLTILMNENTLLFVITSTVVLTLF